VTDLKYPILIKILSDEDGGGYLAYALDLHGCLGDGGTPEEAIVNLKDAILEWIDEARRLNRPIPVPGEVLENAHKERVRIHGIILKQQKLISQQQQLINQQTKTVNRVKDEIEELRGQISELADKPDLDYSDPIWGRSMAANLTVAKKIRHSKSGLQH
jgi:antitoxin HicB